MTIQKRTLINLRDIVAIEYECHSCHSRCSVPIDRTADRRIGKCPNCNEDWIQDRTRRADGESSDEQLVSFFVDRLRQLQDRQLEGVRLQLAEPPPE